MIYHQETLDRQTGDLISTSLGDWITISELASLYEIGPRKARVVLRHLGFLQLEGGSKQNRHRLCSWVVTNGWGKRIERKGAIPFDTIGPQAQEWIADRWFAALAEVDGLRTTAATQAAMTLEAFRQDRNFYRKAVGRQEMDVVEMVSWLNDHFPELSHPEIATILDVSQQLVSRYLGEREGEKGRLKRLKSSNLPVKAWSLHGEAMDRL